VNTGLTANFGLRYILEDVKGSLYDGDVVIVMPEYEMFFGKLDGGPMLFTHLLNSPSGAASISSAGQVRTLLGAVPYFVQNRLTRYLNDMLSEKNSDAADNLRGRLYEKAPFNKYGDTVNKDSTMMYSGLRDWGRFRITDLDESAVDYLASFIRESNRRTTVVLCYPGIPLAMYRQSGAALDSLDRLIRVKTGMKDVRPPIDWTLDDEFFLDTVYHLNTRGRSRRTEMIIDLLTKRLPTAAV
jgi:hypothetical protein